ncbi:MAG TPA: nucleotidyltransferase family protein [Thermoanaerobaculia bacterium]|nr:nucleotidyltransferase family protein [Thermoanaerobaculia bacterium]
MIALAVLAAGGSRRYGSPKQLAVIDGETLLHRAARVAAEWAGRAGDRRAFVVLGAHIADVNLEVVLNPNWDEGLSTSIHAAVHAAGDADALLLMLCDQPGITADDLERITNVRAPIVAAAYENTIGVPALFHRSQFGALLALRGDRGAKPLLENAATVPIPAAAWDVDVKPE